VTRPRRTGSVDRGDPVRPAELGRPTCGELDERPPITRSRWQVVSEHRRTANPTASLYPGGAPIITIATTASTQVDAVGTTGTRRHATRTPEAEERDVAESSSPAQPTTNSSAPTATADHQRGDPTCSWKPPRPSSGSARPASPRSPPGHQPTRSPARCARRARNAGTRAARLPGHPPSAPTRPRRIDAHRHSHLSTGPAEHPLGRSNITTIRIRNTIISG